MNVQRSLGLILAAGLVVASCGGEGQQAQDTGIPTDTAAEPTGGMPGMEAMQGGMMGEMMAHMQMMAGAGADSMQALMPMHRQMAANMIAQMNREMRDMNMTADANWNATVDSLRQDLTRMPEMSAGELQTLMPEHHARMMRLMEMHGAMMSAMQM